MNNIDRMRLARAVNDVNAFCSKYAPSIQGLPHPDSCSRSSLLFVFCDLLSADIGPINTQAGERLLLGLIDVLAITEED